MPNQLHLFVLQFGELAKKFFPSCRGFNLLLVLVDFIEDHIDAFEGTYTAFQSGAIDRLYSLPRQAVEA